MRTSTAAITYEKNNFDLIRLFASYLVLVSHSYPLFGHAPEIVATLMGYETGGGLAVSIFFFVSGHLVLGSLCRRRDLMSFAFARALRILPGLFFSVMFCVLIVGPIFTDLSLSDYFRSADTWAFFKNAFVFPIQFLLPGVFAHSPQEGVNGSLWTLPIEVTMYFLLFLLFRSGLLRKSLACIIPIMFFCALSIGQTFWNLGWENRGGYFFYSVPVYNFLSYGIFFFSGCAYFVFREYIRPNSLAAIAAFCIFVSTFKSPYGFVGEVVALPYLIYYLAYWRFTFWRPTHDISYGVYIYAFPVQQAVYAYSSSFLGFWEMMALAALITTVLASLSWHFVERPALGLKQKLTFDSVYFSQTIESAFSFVAFVRSKF